MLQFLHNLKDKICQPDPKLFPNPEERAESYIKNVYELCYFNLLLLFYLCFNLYSGFLNTTFLAIIIPHIIYNIIFVVFCRTRISICYAFKTFFFVFGPSIYFQFNKHAFLYSFILSLLTPVLVSKSTKSSWQIILSAFAVIFMINFKHQYYLQEVLFELDPREFAQTFANVALIILFMSAISELSAINIVEKKVKLHEMAKDEAQTAYSQLNLFLQTFSHELRNPLNSLLGNLQLALHENIPPKIRDMIESSKVCADLLLQHINNILDTGKTQVGKLDIHTSPTRVYEFISGVWRISRELIRRKKLLGYLKIDKKMPSQLEIDGYRINQILLNLVGNAIKFTEKGQISIRFNWLPHLEVTDECFMPLPYEESDVEEGVADKDENINLTFPDSESSDHLLYIDTNLKILDIWQMQAIHREKKGVLQIVVQDTGSGISPQNIELLFNKFSQVSDDPKKRKIGTGLGLYITKEICETLGGQIRTFSKVGTGTTFIVCIPTQSPVQPGRAKSLTNVLEGVKNCQMDVLLVDENPYNLDLLASYCLRLGRNIVGAGSDVLEDYSKYLETKVENTRLLTILIDVDTKKNDGKKLCQKIREYEMDHKLKPAKIVVISTNRDETKIQELIDKCGMYKIEELLQKPVSFESFANTLGKITGL